VLDPVVVDPERGLLVGAFGSEQQGCGGLVLGHSVTHRERLIQPALPFGGVDDSLAVLLGRSDRFLPCRRCGWVVGGRPVLLDADLLGVQHREAVAHGVPVEVVGLEDDGVEQRPEVQRLL
jgi:hypothetical protein